MQNENEILWTAAFLNERFTSVVSPLGWSFIGSLFEQLALRDPLRYMGFPEADKIPAVRLWHGHPYVNTAIFQIFYKPFPDMFVPADAVRYFPNGNLAYRKHAPYPHSMFQPRFLISLAYHLVRDPVVTSPLNYLAWQRFTAQHDAQINALKKRLDRAANAQEVLWVTFAAHLLDAQFLHVHRWSLTYADLFYKVLAKWAHGDAQELMSHVPNKTREVNAQIAALGQRSWPLSAELLRRIDSHATLNDAEQETANVLAAFLERHGHRAFSLDIAQPTFRDEPGQLLAFMPHAGTMPKSEFADQRTEHEKRIQEKARRNPLVALARRYAQLREDQRYYWQKSLAVTRRAYLILGDDLAARQLVSGASDIFFAVREEITSYYGMESMPEGLAERIAARKNEWHRYAELDRVRGADAYPLFLRGDTPLTANGQTESRRVEWHGRGVSAGIVRGIARIVHQPRDLGRVGAGEILVAPSTDPAWTPVFGRLKGLVLERGGVLSHGAVVAREYHLPAVTAVTNLTYALEDGEWIELDGTTGIVRRVTKPE